MYLESVENVSDCGLQAPRSRPDNRPLDLSSCIGSRSCKNSVVYNYGILPTPSRTIKTASDSTHGSVPYDFVVDTLCALIDARTNILRKDKRQYDAQQKMRSFLKPQDYTENGTWMTGSSDILVRLTIQIVVSDRKMRTGARRFNRAVPRVCVDIPFPRGSVQAPEKSASDKSGSDYDQ